MPGTDNADKVLGYAGNDQLFGKAGHDILNGGEGNDKLFGGTGNDQLYRGTGNDVIEGGSGKDVFIFATMADSTVKTFGRDTILDFNGKAGDRIDLSGMDANSKSSGNQTFAFVGADEFPKKPGELRFEKTASDTFIYGDIDGDGNADFTIQVAGSTTFLKDYFVL